MPGVPEDVETFVKNAHKLISVFGSWPSFHDAEVCGARLDRNGPTLEIDIFVFKTSRETEESGYYRRSNKMLVTFRFQEIEEMVLDGFNHQNVLAGLTLRNDRRIEVTLESIFGLGGRFLCGAVEVSKVVPFPL